MCVVGCWGTSASCWPVGWCGVLVSSRRLLILDVGLGLVVGSWLYVENYTVDASISRLVHLFLGVLVEDKQIFV